MKFSTAAGAILAIQQASARLHSHDRLAAIERRHHHLHQRANHQAQSSPVEAQLEERQASTCAFPTNLGLQYVQGDSTGDLNAGWAMSGDHPCTEGTWCQYSCPSGTLMTSWNPAIPNYPSSEGGVFCGPAGIVLPDGPLCKEGAMNIQAVDATGKGTSFCQTVAPGNEAQLIATWVPSNSQTTLAIPKPDYFSQISAHYYINIPGTTTGDACKWGSSSSPVGNWAPLVGGGHQTADGTTWIDLGLNPEYKDIFSSTPINFKVEIICDGQCNNPCAYDPSKHGFLEMVGQEGTAWSLGDDGAPFCTTVVSPGSSAYYKVSMLDGSDTGSGSGSGSSPAPSSSSAAAVSSSATTAAPPSKSHSSSVATSSSSSSSSSSAVSSSSSFASISGASNATTPTATASQATWSPHILLQGTANSTSTGGSSSNPTATTSTSSTGSAGGSSNSSSNSTSFGTTSYSIPHIASLAISCIALFLLL